MVGVLRMGKGKKVNVTFRLPQDVLDILNELTKTPGKGLNISYSMFLQGLLQGVTPGTMQTMARGEQGPLSRLIVLGKRTKYEKEKDLGGRPVKRMNKREKLNVRLYEFDVKLIKKLRQYYYEIDSTQDTMKARYTSGNKVIIRLIKSAYVNDNEYHQVMLHLHGENEKIQEEESKKKISFTREEVRKMCEDEKYRKKMFKKKGRV